MRREYYVLHHTRRTLDGSKVITNLVATFYTNKSARVLTNVIERSGLKLYLCNCGRNIRVPIRKVL